MLLRNRPPGLDSRPTTTRRGFEHLDQKWISVLRWLRANRVDFVLVGAVAEAVRGGGRRRGPVTIVLAPYERNFERLGRALAAADARPRGRGPTGEKQGEGGPGRVTAERLAGGQQWTVRCGTQEIDLRCHLPGAPGYQELLYEASRFQLADGLAVEVGSPEDIEHYTEVGRTDKAPEIKISRTPRARHDAGQ